MALTKIEVSSISNSAITTAKIADVNVTTAKIADDAVTLAKWLLALMVNLSHGMLVVILLPLQ
jgi:hypothetical protein